jgi:hypothetical protein
LGDCFALRKILFGAAPTVTIRSQINQRKEEAQMPTIIIAVTPNNYDPISPDWCRYVQSGVYRFTAGDHQFTMIFSEVEVTRETTEISF